MGKEVAEDTCKASYKCLQFSSGNFLLFCLFDPSEKVHLLKEPQFIFFATEPSVLPRLKSSPESLPPLTLHYLHTKWFYAKYPYFINLFIIINVQVHICFENKKIFFFVYPHFEGEKHEKENDHYFLSSIAIAWFEKLNAKSNSWMLLISHTKSKTGKVK